ncbi:MAG TPA: hypothetical protein VK486_03515 [Thermoleophilaceae bacterium]|nr:hypothetical protein [Thermoleophilaceae bacterium]
MARLAIAGAVLAGLLVLPSVAAAGGEPKGYHGTLTIDQRYLKDVPAGSSMTYRLHARYSVSGRRQHPYGAQRGWVYSLAGGGNQTLDMKLDLHRADSSGTRSLVADWHGAGRWTKHSGQVAVLNVFGRQFGVSVDLNLPPKSIPLSVTSEERDVLPTDDGTTCTFGSGVSDSRIWVEDPCSDDFRTLSIPKGTAVNVYSLLSEGDPIYHECRGPRVSIRRFNGFCGSAKHNGRIHFTHREVWPHSLDYPFIPWRDQDAAFHAQEAANFFFQPSEWPQFPLQTTYKLDLRPG